MMINGMRLCAGLFQIAVKIRTLCRYVNILGNKYWLHMITHSDAHRENKHFSRMSSGATSQMLFALLFGRNKCSIMFLCEG